MNQQRYFSHPDGSMIALWASSEQQGRQMLSKILEQGKSTREWKYLGTERELIVQGVISRD